MLAVHRQRMLRLRYVMCNVALEEELRANDIGPVRTLEEFNIMTVGHVREDRNENLCLTAACVIGSAAFDPVLRSHGLDYETEQEWAVNYALIASLPYRPPSRIRIVLDGERQKYDSPKLAAFFGLTALDYDALVSPGGYLNNYRARPRDVVRKIDWLLLKNAVETFICLGHVIQNDMAALEPELIAA